MSKIWVADYKGHTIQVENSWRGEKLVVDGVVQDEHYGFATRATLWGRIKSEGGEVEEIKANLGQIFTVQCRLFVDNQAVAVTRQ
ncbi:MAG TPA: hypothetical protein VFP95_03405 [Gammaproteobacteria bacterium]|nr:hypothetical protein [Gammaproteobacteria bacterium]